ncbi:Transcription factor UPBEAT1 [Hibiscus syriacus]|uniref:Transcription factor UPBEAT1 n=1 Tax=Hibiscus syriacus TaxID=106335 RepID=A0A6A3ARP9_HIBSY|nr:transcription factor UPBEAT1-like [Hibiscus syriacus]KAE8707274.1 Transcription factor UPBEAT1 [Hibiscus syriacus]
MGISQLSFHSNDANGSLWSKPMDANGERRSKSRPRTRSVLTKKRAVREGSRRVVVNPIQKKVKTLRRLIPGKDSMGLEGLFRETAEYILCLQMRVKVMQILVQVLTEE